MDNIVLTKDAKHFLKLLEQRGNKILKGKSLIELPIAEARKAFDELVAPLPDHLHPIDIKVENKSIPQNGAEKIPVRVYTPKNTSGPLPILVYFHGGGFVFGGLNFLDYACRFLAMRSTCIVIAVDFRNAPEHKFPAAHDDAYHATQYIYENAKEFGGYGLIAVGGDSAGGNLAASVCHMAKKSKHINIAFQLLFYPWVDLNNTTASDKKYARGYFLELNTLDWMRKQYLSSPADEKNPIANPQFQTDFKGLPPALIINGEVDPIHDDAKMYYQKLVAADVEAQFVEFAGTLHDFCALPSHYEAALLAFEVASHELKKAFEI